MFNLYTVYIYIFIWGLSVARNHNSSDYRDAAHLPTAHSPVGYEQNI